MRRLVNMGIKPERKDYRPPPRQQCENDKFTIYLTGDANEPHVLVVRYSLYRGKYVDFSMNQTILVDGKSMDVARIDCCHGKIHRHQFDRDGKDLLQGLTICEIPADKGWEVVHTHYLKCLGIMDDEWEDNLRRWNGDGA